MALGRPIQMEKSRCSEDNTSTNSAFAQSSLPKDFHLLTSSVCAAICLFKYFFKFFAQRPKAEQKAAGLVLLFHCSGDTNHIQPHSSLSLQARELKSHREGRGNPKGKRIFPVLLVLAAACEVLLFKQLGHLQKWAPRAFPAGQPEGSGCSSHPSICPFIPSALQWETLRVTQLWEVTSLVAGKLRGPRDVGESPHQSAGQQKKSLKCPRRWRN